MTTKQEISDWFDRGRAQGAAHMLVICDTFDYEDYPVYTRTADECLQRYKAPGEMQRVMEVYDLAAPKDEQMGAGRVLRLPAPPGPGLADEAPPNKPAVSLSAAQAGAAPEGWKLVPVKATREMLVAAQVAPAYGHPETAVPTFAAVYEAMLAAAPSPKCQEDKGGSDHE